MKSKSSRNLTSARWIAVSAMIIATVVATGAKGPKFEDGTKRLATPEDFVAEEKWMAENLPFPTDAYLETGEAVHRMKRNCKARRKKKK